MAQFDSTQLKNDECRQAIKDFLSNYEDGWNVLINASSWDAHVKKVEGADPNAPTDWLAVSDRIISIISDMEFGLDTYPNMLEIIDEERLHDMVSKNGMPIMYDHWSFGKRRMQLEQEFAKGGMGKIYEMVINSNPVLAYEREDNTKTMMLLVIAHASYGHNAFFKNNYMFSEFTDADNIFSHLRRLKDYVNECEEKYGAKPVERLLDACHALESHGVNRFQRSVPRDAREEAQLRARLEMTHAQQEQSSSVIDRIKGPKPSEQFKRANEEEQIPDDLAENLMRWQSAFSPHLEDWHRDIIRMKSEIAQYFYPQKQTQVGNEGTASTMHYECMNLLWGEGLIDDQMMQEFIQSHTAVLSQPGMYTHPETGQKMPSQINPYALGFAIIQDMKRVCYEPTEEDKEWFPFTAGCEDWIDTFKDIIENYKDESLILQYLSPKVMRDFGFFAVYDDDREDHMVISAIHNQEGYARLRQALASQYRLTEQQPRIEVAQYNHHTDRSLVLHHYMHKRRPLEEQNMEQVLAHMYQLHGHPVVLHSFDMETGELDQTLSWPGNMWLEPQHEFQNQSPKPA